MADKQISWASRHGAIFDVKKSKWIVFAHSEIEPSLSITFGDRANLHPEKETNWLGVILDRDLSFKRHRQEVIAKGTKRAHFLSSLSNTKWGIPPHLFKTLITSMVHAATDYAVAAWINLPIPKCFSEKLTSIDTICVTKALGALKNSPTIFLRHDLDLKLPEVRLSEKIASTIAIIASRPPNHPLYHYYDHSRKTKPRAHKGPLHAYFQSNLADVFKRFEDIQQPDSTKPLPPNPNFGVLIIPDKEKTIKSIQALRPSATYLIIYSDGSKIEGKNTAAAAW